MPGRPISRRAALVLLALLAGCASDPWSDYPDSLYESLKEDTAEARREHAELLGEIIAYSEKKGSRPPPGVHAELAYYQSLLGEKDRVEDLLRREQEIYPESAPFVAMMRRMLAGQAPTGGGKP